MFICSRMMSTLATCPKILFHVLKAIYLFNLILKLHFELTGHWAFGWQITHFSAFLKMTKKALHLRCNNFNKTKKPIIVFKQHIVATGY